MLWAAFHDFGMGLHAQQDIMGHSGPYGNSLIYTFSYGYFYYHTPGKIPGENKKIDDPSRKYYELVNGKWVYSGYTTGQVADAVTSFYFLCIYFKLKSLGLDNECMKP